MEIDEWLTGLSGLGIWLTVVAAILWVAIVQGVEIIERHLREIERRLTDIDQQLSNIEDTHDTLHRIEDDVSAPRDVQEPEEDWDEYGVGMGRDNRDD